MNTNQKISLNILALMATGMDVLKAFDSVLGAGAARKLADEVYDALREKALS